MDNAILGGLIGLLGAVVGASAAFSGVVYQQRRQADLARQERLDALAERAVDTLIQELEHVRDLAWKWNEAHETREWRDALSKHSAAISLAVLRLPDKTLRENIQAAVILGFGSEQAFQDHVDLQVPPGIMAAMAGDAQKSLGAYLRQEPSPPTTFLYRAHPFVQSIITHRIRPSS